MKFKIYRDNIQPRGKRSFHILVKWPNGLYSYEAILLDDQPARDYIPELTAELERLGVERMEERPAIAGQLERAREWTAMKSEEH